MKNAQLAKIIRKGSAKREAPNVNELESLLLQISFAIMMVFMMAYFLFRAEAKKEQEEQLLELERQKLVIAAEAADTASMARYGLDMLVLTNSPSTSGLKLLKGDQLSDDTFIKGAFLKAAQNGAKDFSDTLSLRREWIADVYNRAGLDAASVSKASADWVNSVADDALARYEELIRKIEYRAVAELQGYWLKNPSKIDDPKIADILQKLDTANEDSRLLLVTELSTALRRYGIERLQILAGAEMLP